MDLYQFDTFSFDPARGELREQNRGPVPLRHKVSRLLEYLLVNRERLVSKEELLENLWQHGDYRENSLTQSIRELRKALGDSAQNSSYIKTFPQRGYQWVCPVTQTVSTAEEKVAEEETVNGKAIEHGRPWARLAAISVVLLLAVMGIWKVVGAGPAAEVEQAGTPKLLVLPFANDTGDPARDWLQLGLSDMLASSLQRAGQIRVTPPAISQGLLLSEGLDWPTLPSNLRALLRERGYDQALLASVREQGEGQVLDYQLLFAGGRTRQGSMTYTSLTANSSAIARQLMYLIHPQGTPQPNAVSDASGTDAVLASQAWAQGLSALQTAGPARADDYFQAALLLTPDDPWLRASRGKTQLLLGDWQGAEQLFEAIDGSSVGDPGLAAFTRYWQAELAYRAGEDTRARALTEEAIGLAQPENNVRVLADAYRLRARIAWSNYQWNEHRELLAQAHELLPQDNDLQVEAEKLFYLGNPISQGPEKDPQRDLPASREQLQKALNYYLQLGNRPMIAASQVALARNYRIDLDSRRAALAEAIALFEELRLPYELAEALVYAAFFHLQLHDGAAAEFYVEWAEQVIEQLGDHRRSGELAFYRAFALLDQGLDQRHAGRHSQNPKILRSAIAQFEHLIKNADSELTRGHALMLMGWAYTDLEEYSQAEAVLEESRRLSEKLQLRAWAGNAAHSLMYLHLSTGEYEKVLTLADAPVMSPPQLGYLARAHYELGQYNRAAETLSRIENLFPEQWTDAEQARLNLYRRAGETDEALPLSPEVPAHAVYCESDWLFNKAAERR